MESGGKTGLFLREVLVPEHNACNCCNQVPGYLGNSDMVGVEAGHNLPDLAEKRMYQL